MTIGDQSMSMFQDEDTEFTELSHRIHGAMCSIVHSCRTIQASVGHLSLIKPGRSSITLLDQ